MQLGDDEFEEHILEYPPDRAGLYLHGINQNDPEFITWPYSKLREFATQFGFHIVDCIVVNTVDGNLNIFRNFFFSVEDY